MNKIVKIIHLCAQQWGGKPTKNYGERYMITWKLVGYDKAIDASDERRASNASNMLVNDDVLGSEKGGAVHSQNESQRDDVFGKAAESVGNQSITSGKVDERTSLLPDGT